MARSAQEILDEALLLPEEDRHRIADSLWRSVDANENDSVEQAWVIEAQHRAADIENGSVTPESHEQVMNDLRARISR